MTHAKPALARLLAALIILTVLAGCSGPSWVSLTAVAGETAVATAPPVAAAAITRPPAPTLALPTPPPQPSPTQPAPAEYLVLLSLDAFRPQYLDLAEMPNLKSLLRSGVAYRQAWVGALENNTPTGHTEMSTGSFPRRNGIIGFNWADLATGRLFNPTSDQAIQRGDMAGIVERSGVPTLAGLIKARYPDGIVAAVSSSKYYAAQALGVGPADFILVGQPDGDGVYHPTAINGRTPSREFLKDPEINVKPGSLGGENGYTFTIAKKLVETYQPRALLLNLLDTDTAGHNWGGLSNPDTLRPILKTTDRALGELMGAYRQAGIFEQTLWVITADHGMTPKSDIIVPAEVYQAIGFTFRDNEQSFLPEVRLIDHAQARPLAAKIAALKLPGITGAYYRVKNEDGYGYQPASTTRDTLSPDLNSAYLYLLGTFAGAYSPDVVVTTSGTVGFDKRHESPGGSHNMINWADQHILMGFAGPGTARAVDSAAPARPVDILPTVARLMDLPAPDADGSILADALLSPLAEELAAQQGLNAELVPLRDALAETGE